MSAQAKAEHNSKKQAYYDSLKGNGVPESNYTQSNQMTAIMQLLAMPEAERTQLCSQANTLQQLLNSSQQNNTAMVPTPTVANNNGNPAPASANIGNILTQLLQANTAKNTGGDQRRLFTAKTSVVHTNVDAPKKIIKNIDIAARQAPGLKYFLDFSDMEPSEKGLVNCDFSADDCSAAPSLEISHCSEYLQHDYINDEEQSLGSEGDWEPLSSPPTFMDNVVPIDVTDKPVDFQQLDFFSDTLEAPLESVQNELEVFDDAAEDIFYDTILAPEETPLMELCQPDVFIYTPEHIVCGIRQCFFNLTRYIGQSDSIAFEGYSPIDSGADTVFCGQGCRNEELDDNRKVEVIGCHGSIDKPPFNIGSNLTKVYGENKQPIILRIPESICAGEGKSLFAANQMRAAGHIVNDVPKRYGGQQCIKLHDGPTIPLFYHQGLCHMKTHFPTDDDLKVLPVFDLTLDTPWNPANEYDDDTGVAPEDIRDIYQFATKYIMLYDDAELQDPIIAEAEAQLNDSYTTWTARINQLTSKVSSIWFVRGSTKGAH